MAQPQASGNGLRDAEGAEERRIEEGKARGGHDCMVVEEDDENWVLSDRDKAALNLMHVDNEALV